MLGMQYTGLALRHWQEWLPKMTQELRDQGQLNHAAQMASKRAAEQVAKLMEQGMQQHEAEEMVLPQEILFKPEESDEDEQE
ncbi:MULTISPECIES: hypothetical protein [Giesbergeria]|uniref:Uncharacterized protein n=1 Tax=Giesbergeria sinuosa TaxID=80883 RepID=A0ABV9QKQ8_9BURK